MPYFVPNERLRILLLLARLEIENIGLHLKPRDECFYGSGKSRVTWEYNGQDVHDPLII